jgi:protease-4
MKRHWLLVLSLCLVSCHGRQRTFEDGETSSLGAFLGLPDAKAKVLEIDLSHGVPETFEGALVPVPAKRTYLGLVRALDAAAQDAALSGVFVRIGGTELGWARSEEIGRLLGAIRAKGKPVVCHAHGLGNAGTLLTALGCDKIWLSPAGGVEAVGIAAQVLYLRRAFDRFKVRADFVHIGEYKSAAEGFTREGPSDEAKRDLTQTLSALREAWLNEAGKRKQTKERAVLEQGPYGAEDARSRGLVDAVGYESEAKADAEQRGGASKTTPAFGPAATSGEFDLAEVVREIAGADDRSGGRPRIAVVPAVGAIAMTGGGMFETSGISERALGKVLRRLAKDDSVKAVVLRIDSPGGSALASDLLWHELKRLKEKKPIVASVGDMAASGGYYLACAANRVIAERTSIVGSIGVVGGKLTFDEALADFGVNAVTFPANPDPALGSRAAYMSALTPWDDATRERIRLTMTEVYELFLKRVAVGRGKSVADIRKIAEGRIYGGVRGKEIGLVDELGGLSRALGAARELASLDAGTPVTLEGAGETLVEMLFGAPDEQGAESRVLDAASLAKRLSAVQAQNAALARVVPPSLQRHLASFEPLTRERTVTALPFALGLD